MAKNRGEWSELLVFLKLLSTGSIPRADTQLKVIDGSSVNFRSVVRNHDQGYYRYSREQEGVNITTENGSKVGFADYKVLHDCLKKIQSSIMEKGPKGGAFEVKGVTDCLAQLLIDKKVSQSSIFKHDILLDVFDPITKSYQQRGFSVKSFVGANPTLLNPSQHTKVRYYLDPGLPKAMTERINAITSGCKLQSRIRALAKSRARRKDPVVMSQMFRRNLTLVDTGMCTLFSEMLWSSLQTQERTMLSVLDDLVKRKSIKYGFEDDLELMKYKISHLLSEMALGLLPSKSWSGAESVTGGFVIVQKSAEIVCFLSESRQQFWEYLLVNSVFDSPSSGRYDYGTIHRENGEVFIDLCAQIRFRNPEA